MKRYYILLLLTVFFGQAASAQFALTEQAVKNKVPDVFGLMKNIEIEKKEIVAITSLTTIKKA